MSPKEDSHPKIYSVRWFENGHIVLWLFKDLCWVTTFKIGGIIMMVPTLLLGIYITFLSKKNISELYLNWNLIGSQGGLFLAEALQKNFNISVLDLSCNNLGN